MSSIKKNFLYNLIYQILLIILPLITTPYISRVLGADGVGVYTYTYTIANYFMLFAMLGVKNYGNRSIAMVRDNKERLSKTFWEIYALQFFCAFISLISYNLFIFFFERDYFTISLIQGIFVFSGMIDISWFFFGLEKFKITVIRNIVIRLSSLCCVFLFVKTPNDLWKYTLIMSLGLFLSQLYLWRYVSKLVFWCRPGPKHVLSHFKAELILFIPVIAVSLYKMMDKIMLKQMSTITQVGYYESAEKVLNIPLGVITALGTVMLPRMSNLAAKQQTGKSKEYIHHSMLFAMFLASAMMFGIAGISPDFVPLFFGDGYLPCIQLMEFMAPTILFISWANVIRTQYLIPYKKDLSYIISVSLGAVVNLVINMLLIPYLHALGATIATVLAEAVVCLCQTIMVHKKLDIGHYFKDSILFLFFGMIMFLFIRLISSLNISVIPSLVIEIFFGGILYCILSFIYLVISHFKLKELIGFIKK